MGKSNKKLKAERINAIRKQYDAFLEEEKKRKDRNEYILERLDKIRASSAIVQVRNASKDYFATVNQHQSVNDRKDHMEKNLPMYEKSQYAFMPSNNTTVVTSINEQVMLKEISKKYILIPRYTNIFEYNDSCPTKSYLDDNGDWRSKYRILEELKQSEKEHSLKTNLDLSKDSTTKNINSKELDCDKIEETNLHNQIKNTQLLSSGFSKQSSEKHQDNSGVIASFENVNSSTETDRLSQNPEIARDLTDNSENTTDLNLLIINSKTENLTRNTDTEKQANTSLESPQPSPTRDENVDFSDERVNERYIENTDLITNDLTEKEKIQTQYEEKLKPKEEDNQFDKDQYSNIDIGNQNLTEISPKSEIYQQDNIENEIYEENNSKTNIDSDTQHSNDISNENSDKKLTPADVNESLLVDNTNYTEDKNYMQEINTVQEEINDKNENEENKIESQDVPTTVYVNPGEQEFENTGNETQIDEFEVEQTEMFYSDPNVTEYAYDQTGNNVNADYTNNEGYVQDENYAYYEGTPQQQVYSGEINDHEESTEQYDPHYQEQYANYAQQEQINPTLEQYEAGENVDQSQIYEQVQFEEPDYNVVKEVEGQLDAEQNYIVPINQNENVDNIINKAVIPEHEEVIENRVPPPIN